MADNQSVSFEDVHQFVDGLFADDLHAKRVLSLANSLPLRRRGQRSASLPAARSRSA
jgi:hypothetical protein